MFEGIESLFKTQLVLQNLEFTCAKFLLRALKLRKRKHAVLRRTTYNSLLYTWSVTTHKECHYNYSFAACIYCAFGFILILFEIFTVDVYNLLHLRG